MRMVGCPVPLNSPKIKTKFQTVSGGGGNKAFQRTRLLSVVKGTDENSVPAILLGLFAWRH